MRLLILNHLDDDFADYGRYVDHDRHRVAYVTVPTHLPMVPAATAHVELVPGTDDAATVVAAAERCRAAVGGFDKVLALSEFDLLVAAVVREALGVPGPDTAATMRFRDKPTMKEVLGEAGLRAPRFRVVRDVDDVESFRREVGGGAVVVKPRTGAASIGCVVLPAGADPYEALSGIDLDGFQVDEFLSGPIWHVDGLLRAGELLCSRPSRYVNTCYDFARGVPLGSVVQSGPTADAVVDFADRSLRALGITDGAFHLEVIEADGGLAFLEVGARVGGGEIPFVFRDVYGVDLVGDWIRIELGEPPRTTPGRDTGEHAGFLMLPEAVGLRVVARRSMVGAVPGLYAEVLPPVGHVFDGHGGYETLLGRFRYRGATAGDVERAIARTLSLYEYELAPADAELGTLR